MTHIRTTSGFQSTPRFNIISSPTPRFGSAGQIDSPTEPVIPQFNSVGQLPTAPTPTPIPVPTFGGAGQTSPQIVTSPVTRPETPTPTTGDTGGGISRPRGGGGGGGATPPPGGGIPGGGLGTGIGLSDAQRAILQQRQQLIALQIANAQAAQQENDMLRTLTLPNGLNSRFSRAGLETPAARASRRFARNADERQLRERLLSLQINAAEVAERLNAANIAATPPPLTEDDLRFRPTQRRFE